MAAVRRPRFSASEGMRHCVRPNEATASAAARRTAADGSVEASCARRGCAFRAPSWPSAATAVSRTAGSTSSSACRRWAVACGCRNSPSTETARCRSAAKGCPSARATSGIRSAGNPMSTSRATSRRPGIKLSASSASTAAAPCLPARASCPRCVVQAPAVASSPVDAAIHCSISMALVDPSRASPSSAAEVRGPGSPRAWR